MKIDDIAVALYDAKMDKIPTTVLVQKIKTINKETKKYWLRIGDKKYAISEKIALNAIARPWCTPVENLPTKYSLIN
jgi:hypothetical protein